MKIKGHINFINIINMFTVRNILGFTFYFDYTILTILIEKFITVELFTYNPFYLDFIGCFA